MLQNHPEREERAAEHGLIDSKRERRSGRCYGGPWHGRHTVQEGDFFYVNYSMLGQLPVHARPTSAREVSVNTAAVTYKKGTYALYKRKGANDVWVWQGPEDVEGAK